jgi:hypothetical protein
MSIVLNYFLWWYTEGLERLLKYLKAFVIILADAFSVRIILRTFFQPWKKDISSTEGLSLDKKFQVWIWNLISRFFGMAIKGLTFLVFLVCFFVLLAIEILFFLFWLFFPFVILSGIGYSIYYIIQM